VYEGQTKTEGAMQMTNERELLVRLLKRMSYAELLIDESLDDPVAMQELELQLDDLEVINEDIVTEISKHRPELGEKLRRDMEKLREQDDDEEQSK
jgi:hypothetical protein